MLAVVVCAGAPFWLHTCWDSLDLKTCSSSFHHFPSFLREPRMCRWAAQQAPLQRSHWRGPTWQRACPGLWRPGFGPCKNFLPFSNARPSNCASQPMCINKGQATVWGRKWIIYHGHSKSDRRKRVSTFSIAMVWLPALVATRTKVLVFLRPREMYCSLVILSAEFQVKYPTPLILGWWMLTSAEIPLRTAFLRQATSCSANVPLEVSFGGSIALKIINLFKTPVSALIEKQAQTREVHGGAKSCSKIWMCNPWGYQVLDLVCAMYSTSHLQRPAGSTRFFQSCWTWISSV